MTAVRYLEIGLIVMLLKFAAVLVWAHRNPNSKAELKKVWNLLGFSLGVLGWPIELIHLICVIVNNVARSLIEAA